MIAMQKPLFALTAADLMTQTVIAVPEHMSLPCAARLLSQAQISGAPVVDAEGRCVGVLSATDFLHWAEGGKGHACCQDAAATYTPAWQIVDPNQLPENEVRAHMTADPVTAAPAATIGELAHMMLNAHIHRVIIIKPDGHPIGMVSSTDLLAALVQAEEIHRYQEKADALRSWATPLDSDADGHHR